MDNVAEIKEKLSVAEVLRGYINLIPAGKNLKALCPFHKEKTPSFMISPERGSWYCFGCAEGGDIFSFVMKYEQVEFFEALKLLAEKAGVAIVSGGGAGDAHKQLYEVNRLAKDFYARELWQNASAHRDSAITYIKERGLKEETVREFEIGLAPVVSDTLLRHLTKERKAMQDIERAGLVLKSDRGTYWDRFRSRVMFPLYNGFGKVVGFTGRVLPTEVATSGLPAVASAKAGFDSAKYVNSPETPIFNKSKLLYGLHKAKSHIRDANTAIVVEGQMDFLMMWQDGVKNVVASSGTALTAGQLEVLRRLADTLILSFDSDPAGLAAAERSIDLAHTLDFNVKILTMADGAKDPADVVASAPGKMAELVKASIPAMEFYFRRYATGADLAARKKNLRVVLAKIKDVSSAVERDAYLRELSMRVGIGDAVLREEMLALAPSAKLSGGGTAEAATPQAAQKKSRREIISERIVAILAAEPGLKTEVLPHAALMPADYRTLSECLGEHGFAGVPAELESLASQLSLRAGFEVDGELPGGPKHELGLLVRELKREHARERLAVMRLELQSKESYGDEVSVEKLRLEIDRAVKEHHNL